MVVVYEVGDGDKFLAVGARRAWAEFVAPGVAVGAALLAEVAGFALGALVDGVGFGGQDGSGCLSSAAPGGLPAGVGAPCLAA